MTLWDVEWFSQKAEKVHRKTWLPWGPRRFPKRAILKDGHKNVYRKKLAKMRRWKYLQDIFTTLLDAQWRWTLQFLAIEFFGSWIAFALIWWLIAFVHGDLHDDHLPLRQAETVPKHGSHQLPRGSLNFCLFLEAESPCEPIASTPASWEDPNRTPKTSRLIRSSKTWSNSWTPCVLNIHGFHSAFLFSLETQHTTGYGLRVITEECPEAIFLLVCQCLIGMTLDSFAISIVFAKLIRSKHATNTTLFSRNAVISQRDGKLCFMFRVGDIRRSRLAGVAARAILIKSERTEEGEVLQNYQTDLTLKADGGSNNLFFLWPLTVYHEIDEASPLYDFTAPEIMKSQKIEVIVVLDATVESTGVSIEAKSSYLASEILWGHNFEPMVSYNRYIDCYETDWSKFDNTRVVNLQQNLDNEGDSDTQESKLLKDDNNYGAGCSMEYPEHINNEVLPPLTNNLSYIRDEMMDFEDVESYLPCFLVMTNQWRQHLLEK